MKLGIRCPAPHAYGFGDDNRELSMLMRQAETLFSPVRIEIFSEDGPRLKKDSEKSAWHVRDDAQLSEINSSIKSNRKLEKFRSALDTAVAVAASYFAANAGTAPTHFPIFSSPIAGDLYSPDQVLIQQNKVRSDTISEFLGNFLSIGNTARPKLLISYHDRSELLELLSKVSSLVDVAQAFGKETRSVKLDSSKSNDEEILSFVLNGNHLPNLNRYLDGDHSILLGWAAAKSAKLLDVPTEAEQIIEDTIRQVTLRLEDAERRSKSFWMTLSPSRTAMVASSPSMSGTSQASSRAKTASVSGPKSHGELNSPSQE